MRRFSALGNTILFLIFIATLQASDVTPTLYGVFQINSINYTDQLFDYSTNQTTRNLEYSGDGINQRSYYSFTTTGTPTYPILGSSTVIGLTVAAPVYSNPQPNTYQSSYQTSTQNYTTNYQAPTQTATQSYPQTQNFYQGYGDTQTAMLVNQILDNSSSSSVVNWASQSWNPTANPYGSMYGGSFGITGSQPEMPQYGFAAALESTPTLLQHDVNGQTFVNTFSAETITPNGAVNFAQVDIPEPSTALLMALGLASLALPRFRRKRVTA